MTTTTPRTGKRKRGRRVKLPPGCYRPDRIPKTWIELLLDIPHYDCRLTAPADSFFDCTTAQHYLDFFVECLRHVEGEVAGRPFVLEHWQAAIVANLFGWKVPHPSRRRGVRRYREGLILTARKNGKTPLGAGLMNAVGFCDGEMGAQNYFAASTRHQAGYAFRHTAGMITQESELRDRCEVFPGGKSIVLHDTDSFIRVLSSDGAAAHGGNPHFTMIDELHAHLKRDLFDALKSATVSANRIQPLTIITSTVDKAGKESACNEEHDYALRVQSNRGDPAEPGYDPNYLPVIYEIPVELDWKDETNWPLANPNLGVSVSLDALLSELRKAKVSPAAESRFRQLHCNQRIQSDLRAIRLEDWDQGNEAIDPEFLLGRECFEGMDLSAVRDLTACVAVFPVSQREWSKDLSERAVEKQDHGELVGDMLYLRVPHIYAPEAMAPHREESDRVPYVTWAGQELMTLTDGNVVDYDRVIDDLKHRATLYKIREVVIDRGFAAMPVCHTLQKMGFKVTAWSMGYLSWSGPWKEVQRLIAAGRIIHGGHRILRWMAGNTCVAEDAHGNQIPSKGKSPDKIDGIYAGAMAQGRALAEGRAQVSVYQRRADAKKKAEGGRTKDE